MSHDRAQTGNWILDALPDDELARLERGLEPYELESYETLFGPDQESPWAYFPSKGVISFVRGFREGSQIEVGVAGREGMAGVHGFLGPGLEPSKAVVQCSGTSHRLDVRVLREEFERSGDFRRLLLRYTYMLLTQLTVTAGCNQLHTVDQRLSRWLLLMSDRVESRTIPLSHEFLSHMLGTGRSRITESIRNLRELGGVSGKRGQIIIDDRRVLETKTCECYEDLRSLCPDLHDPDQSR